MTEKLDGPSNYEQAEAQAAGSGRIKPLEGFEGSWFTCGRRSLFGLQLLARRQLRVARPL
jgi:hypothetical protein